MSYESFAYLYDQLMDEAPYDDWVEYFLRRMKEYRPDCKRVLDVACGTGEMTLRLKEQGFETIGVDLSEDMLSIALQKARDKGYDIPFFQQNMTSLEGLENFDAVIIFCDSLNYLQTEEEFRQTFVSVRNCLAPGGLFLFDVHSIYKIEEVFQDETFAFQGEEVSYIWNSYPGEEPHSVEHELTFFKLENSTGLYRRFDEWHFQRTFPIETFLKWLDETGFTLLSLDADFQDGGVNETSERIFFTARKN